MASSLNSVTDADIQRSLGRIEGKLDALNGSLVSHTKEDFYNFEALNKQIDAIQKLNWMVLGVVSFLVVCIPIGVAYFN